MTKNKTKIDIEETMDNIANPQAEAVETEQAETEDMNNPDDVNDDETTDENVSEADGAEEDTTDSSTEAEDANAKYMRLAADFQNYKRRTEQEKSDIYKFANEKFASGLLEVLDNFERAIDQENQDTSIDEKFLEGMNMIFAQLLNVLKQNGIEEIDALGHPFDPMLHHAVMTEKSDEYKSGEVTKVMQKGYVLKEKVIRPSMVAVAE